MKIQVNTDENIEGREALATRVSATVEHALQRFRDQVTRLEVHLSDQNGGKSGQRDKRCLMEARLSPPGELPVSACGARARACKPVSPAPPGAP